MCPRATIFPRATFRVLRIVRRGFPLASVPRSFVIFAVRQRSLLKDRRRGITHSCPRNAACEHFGHIHHGVPLRSSTTVHPGRCESGTLLSPQKPHSRSCADAGSGIRVQCRGSLGRLRPVVGFSPERLSSQRRARVSLARGKRLPASTPRLIRRGERCSFSARACRQRPVAAVRPVRSPRLCGENERSRVAW